ncbi:MAG TPA: hypothetical protein VJN18_07850 [Polyangiaceae bacterium]|nr:hypothetical protein [Polyangiaceae bacterium]
MTFLPGWTTADIAAPEIGKHHERHPERDVTEVPKGGQRAHLD